MTRDEVIARWQRQREEWKRYRAIVDGAAVADEFLADLAAIEASELDEVLSLPAAARESGYSRDHLARLVREGKIRNAGRPNAPKIRRRDLPRKAPSLPSPPSEDISRVQIARSVVTSHKERNDG